MSTQTSMERARTDSAREAAPRLIDGIYHQPPLHWVGDGFRVAGYFHAIPDAAKKLSPFVLMDYHPEYKYPPSERPRGVGVHPHRGFETVTWAWQGSVAHHDSAGGGGVIGPGDAQWMTAASGVLHKEYHEEGWSRRGGPFQMVQLWVNLPKADKMGPPGYQAIESKDMGVVTLPEGAGTVRILAGEYGGVRGPAKTFTPIDVFDVALAANGRTSFDFPARRNLAVLVMKGTVSLNGQRANLHDFVVFQNVGDRLDIVASEDAQLLVLSGEPIDEPVVQYGPFVMNTMAEIQQAMVDVRSGKFGYLD
ncbi:pirin family protein [Vulgatibacter incomptus]|uniref:Pirin n=1 Tax=Vulgatibacter incomptus TaxID=1391653 RepID=A0A0K1PGH0_9BACT|nr:pirin family protein [Vulgatibacter incomptus]AKU92615.1 Pirin [Vulgatibacter incomptus]